MASRKENNLVVRGGNVAEKFDVAEKAHLGSNKIIRLVSKTPDPLNDIQHGRTIRQHLREFACVLSLVAMAIAGYTVYRRIMFQDGSLANIGAMYVLTGFFLIAGYLTPRLFRPVWESWIKLGEVLGSIVTVAILSVVWFSLFIPFGLTLRLIGRSVMDLTFREGVATYWVDRGSKPADFSLLERQY
jgi:hypothetical protein